MDYVLDPELAAVAAVMPKVDLSDLASAREIERLMFARPPKYEARIPLSVQDITVGAPQNVAGVPVRIYARPQLWAALPSLLYVHGGAFCDGWVAGSNERTLARI